MVWYKKRFDGLLGPVTLQFPLILYWNYSHENKSNEMKTALTVSACLALALVVLLSNRVSPASGQIPDAIVRYGIGKVDSLASCSKFDGPAGCWHNNWRKRDMVCKGKPNRNRFSYSHRFGGRCYCCQY